MIGLDTNILIEAHRGDARFHDDSKRLLEELGNGIAPFALFWPALYGFLRIVTSRHVFGIPTSQAEALEDVRDMISLPCARLLGETERHHEILQRVLRETGVTGNLVPDAHLVALALEHGVDEILTFDGDFARFPQVRSRHPFRR